MGGNPQGNRLKGWRFLVTFFCYRKKVTRQQGETQYLQVAITKKISTKPKQAQNKTVPTKSFCLKKKTTTLKST